jgi:hypothetical protein
MGFSAFAATASRRFGLGCAWAPNSAARLQRLHRTLAMIALAAAWTPLNLASQQASPVAAERGLPNAPGMETPASAPGNLPIAQTDPATLFGTVMDTNGSEIQGARVVLSALSGGDERILKSGGDGEFTFPGLPPGSFKLTVSGPGWGTYISPAIQLDAGDFRILRHIVLPVAASATVRVTADPDELAEEQVRIAVQQRVLGVFPNFYTSYDWNAPPMRARQKFQLVLRSVSDPMTFVGAGAQAGIEQTDNLFPGYGQGMLGYSRRFGAAYADDFVARMLGEAVFPSLFHQDPRYFYKGTGSFHSRAFYAISAAVMARSDDGRWEPDYSQILGSFASGGLSNLYYPAASRGAALTMENGLVDIASRAAENLVREFILKKFTTRAPKGTAMRP